LTPALAVFALASIVGAAPVAAAGDAPPVASGLVLFGSIVPSLTLLPVTDGLGVPSNFPSGPNVVTGYDATGRRLFRRTFRDKIYSYYVFVQLDDALLRALIRLRVDVAGHTVERTAAMHGEPAARAQSVGPQRVRITWNTRAFPRLSCRDESGGSPAPLMLGGDFTAADIRGDTLRCDFSDGVKTAYAGVLLPIETASPKR
jgi:hypothetical protein